MQKLEPPDSHHLDAATGWLGLGCTDDARLELEKISQANRDHADVLEMRWTICARERRWTDAVKIAEREMASVPDAAAGWLHRAYALRRAKTGGLPAAWDALLPAAEKFPREPVIAYNLSCYACQMQQLDIARHWLNRAVTAGKKEVIKQMALADDDLKPLWPEIEEL